MDLLPEGIWPVMLTSFNEDSSIDYVGQKSLIDFYISNSCDGLFAACSSSEILYMQPEEIISLCKATVEYVNGRVPIVAGAYYKGNLREQADFIKRIKDTGVDVPVILANQVTDARASDTQFLNAVEKLLTLTGDMDLGMYESPFPYHRILSAETLKHLAQTGRFVFHKDTCCNIKHILLKINAVKNTRLRFYNANIPTMLESFKAGGNGFCGTALNFYPRIIRWMWENYKRPSKFLEQMNSFVNSGERIFAKSYPMSAKYFLQLQGVNIQLHCRDQRRLANDTDIHNLQMLSRQLSLHYDTITNCSG